MLKDMTLGQFFPGDSVLHRLDPRMKIVLTVLYIVTIFLAKNVWCYAALLVSALALILFSRLSLRVVLRGVRPIVFILLFTMIINLFFTQGETVLFSFWRITVYKEGLLRAVFMALRVLVLVVGTSVFLTYTTSPIVLTDISQNYEQYLRGAYLDRQIRAVSSLLRLENESVNKFTYLFFGALRCRPRDLRGIVI